MSKKIPPFEELLIKDLELDPEYINMIASQINSEIRGFLATQRVQQENKDTIMRGLRELAAYYGAQGFKMGYQQREKDEQNEVG